MGRLREGRLVLDVRTVFAEQEGDLVEAVQWALLDGKATETGTPDGTEERED